MYAKDQTYLLRSNRHLNEDQELVLTSMVKSGIKVGKAVGLLENLAQGKKNLGFCREDAYDYLRQKKKKKLDNGDAMEVFQHFTKKLNFESKFFSTMEVDDDKRLKNFFFRDYRCLKDYGCFGDVISFDTTYRTNKYEMVCAPFIGINHHNQNVFFGFAFLSDETERSFEWLFRTFLESMGGKQPGIIFTDQCQAMMKAIGKVFTCAHHRLCQWHINQNAPSHFGSLKSDSSFKYLWTKCMKYCESEDEFEATWKEMMGYDIVDRQWFSVMYNLRRKWSTVFSNHIFSAGLLATSRSEGTNSALKKEIGNKTSSLFDCVIGYEKVQNSWRVTEKENDTLCRHNKPTLFAPRNPLLIHASNVYTHTIYNLFEMELRDTMDYEIPEQLSCVGNPLALYKVEAHGQSLRCGIVEYNGQEAEIRCSCRKFETVGILCSHALKVFDLVKMKYIPEKYIKKRWTMTIKSDMYNGQSEYESVRNDNRGDGSYLLELAFVNRAKKGFHDFINRGKAREDGRNLVLKHMDFALTDIDALFGDINLNDSVPCDVNVTGEDSTHADDVLVRDPLVAKTRGITNINKRHWEEKRRKGKGKSESSRKTAKSSKHKVQSSQLSGEKCLSQEITKVQQSQSFQETFFAQYAEFLNMGGRSRNVDVNMLYPQPFHEHANNGWRPPNL